MAFNLATPRKRQSRQALLETAERLFIERGYRAVSTRDIAEAAQVNLGAIQYHFGSKAGLFNETVRQMMQAGGCPKLAATLGLAAPHSREEAASTLCGFIRSFMEYQLRPDGPQACKLMFREVLSDSSEEPEMFESLLDLVVGEFVKPMHAALSRVVEKIATDADPTTVTCICRSVVAQCVFYVTHRPVIERIEGDDISKNPHFERTVEHLCRFSLRGMGCDDALIAEAVRGATSLKSQVTIVSN